MDVTNNSKAPQGIHTLDGLVYVMPGETKPVRMDETLHGHAKALDFFTIDGEPETADLGKADNGDIRVTATQMDELKTKFEEQTAEIGRLTSENVDLTAKNTEIEALVVELKTQLAERDQQIAELRTKLEAAEKAVSEAGNASQTAALKAEHHGGGKFNVTQGEAVLLSGLSKSDADAFNAMSDEDKAAYVDASKK